jgi:hypothetical protein
MAAARPERPRLSDVGMSPPSRAPESMHMSHLAASPSMSPNVSSAPFSRAAPEPADGGRPGPFEARTAFASGLTPVGSQAFESPLSGLHSVPEWQPAVDYRELVGYAASGLPMSQAGQPMSVPASMMSMPPQGPFGWLGGVPMGMGMYAMPPNMIAQAQYGPSYPTFFVPDGGVPALVSPAAYSAAASMMPAGYDGVEYPSAGKKRGFTTFVKPEPYQSFSPPPAIRYKSPAAHAPGPFGPPPSY